MASINVDHDTLVLQWMQNGKRKRLPLKVDGRPLRDTRDDWRIAEKKKRDKEAELETGTDGNEVKEPPSLSECVEKWIENQPRLTPGSVYDYTLQLEHQIKPFAVAGMRIDRIKPRHLNIWLKQAQEAGLSAGRINRALKRIRTAYDWAITDGYDIEHNPARNVKCLEEPETLRHPLEEDEIARVYSAAEGGCERALVVTLIEAGLRPEEALGLGREHIDLKNRKIHVQRIRTRWRTSNILKTASSFREVDIQNDLLLQELKKYIFSHIGGDYLFRLPVSRGGPVNWSNFARRNWKNLLVRAKVEHRSAYQCRHTYARRMIRRYPEDLEYIAQQLGHTSLEMLIKVYGKWTKEAKRASRRSNEFDGCDSATQRANGLSSISDRISDKPAGAARCSNG